MQRKTDNFNKFFHKKSNGAIKEAFKQEKKAAKKERKEAIERHFEERRKARGIGPDQAPAGKMPRGGFDGMPDKKARAPHTGPAAKNAPAKPGFKVVPANAPFKGGAPRAKGVTPASGVKRTSPPAAAKPIRSPYAGKSDFKSSSPESKGKPAFKDGAPVAKSGAVMGSKPAAVKPFQAQPPGKPGSKGPAEPAQGANATPLDPNLIPLNKYIAHGGICSRRDAAELIRQGKVQVNGETVTEPGTKVSPTDFVKANGRKVTMSRNFVYILLNKPKDYITTTEDPQGRKTVLDLIKAATPERVYPVGRLDRNTSGVLLLTNDGDLAQKLAHPRHEIKKIYHVTLDKPLTKADFEKIIGPGVQLEDGIATVDVIAYADPKDKTQVGLEIHSGRNRIVRRIFEQLGYDVRGLDRVTYASLTKKNVQRGHWRFLTEKEIRILKYLNSSTKGSHRKGSPMMDKALLNEKVEALLNESPSGKRTGEKTGGGKKPYPAKDGAPHKGFAPSEDGFDGDDAPKDKRFPSRKNAVSEKGFRARKGAPAAAGKGSPAAKDRDFSGNGAPARKFAPAGKGAAPHNGGSPRKGPPADKDRRFSTAPRPRSNAPKSRHTKSNSKNNPAKGH